VGAEDREPRGINIEGPSFRQHVAKSRAERALST
jgi:hypothetical protein